MVLKQLNAMDQISIHTQNSEYQFQVINPAQCRGFLTGGLCGEEPCEAVLVGSVYPGPQRGQISENLETGTCAVFSIALKESVQYLITSVITQV